MPVGDVETYHHRGQWKNRIEGENGAVGAHEDRETAIHEGRNLGVDTADVEIAPSDLAR